MSLVRIGPYLALRCAEVYRGCAVAAYVLAPTEKLHYEQSRAPCDDDSVSDCAAPCVPVRAPIFFELAQMLDVLSQVDAVRAGVYQDVALLDRARADPSSIAHGQRLYVSPALLKESLASISSPRPPHASSLLTFLRREFQSRSPAVVFGTTRAPPVMDDIGVNLASPERTIDLVQPQPDPPHPPSPSPAASEPPPPRKRGRPKAAGKSAAAAAQEAPDDPSVEHSAFHAIMAPYSALAGAIEYGGGGDEQLLRRHMAWCVYLLSTKRVREEVATLLIDRYTHFLTESAPIAPDPKDPPGRKRKAPETDAKHA